MKPGQLFRLTMGESHWQSFFYSITNKENIVPLIPESLLDSNGLPKSGHLYKEFIPADVGVMVLYLGPWIPEEKTGEKDPLARVLYQEKICGIPKECLECTEEI